MAAVIDIWPGGQIVGTWFTAFFKKVNGKDFIRAGFRNVKRDPSQNRCETPSIRLNDLAVPWMRGVV